MHVCLCAYVFCEFIYIYIYIYIRVSKKFLSLTHKKSEKTLFFYIIPIDINALNSI